MTKPTGRPVGRPQSTVLLRVGQRIGLIRKYANGRSRIELFTVAAVSGKRSGNILLQLETDDPGPVEMWVDRPDDSAA